MLALSLIALGSSARSDDSEPGPKQGLIHLDSPSVLQKSAWSGFLEGRFFGQEEDITYGGLGIHLGLGHGLEAGVRAVFAERKFFPLPGGNAIHHGGNDVELVARYGMQHGLTPLAAQVGISFADTPAQRDAFLTLGASASADLGRHATVFLNPRAVLIDNNTIVGIGFGTSIRLSETVSIVGDWTPIIAGDNTRDTTTGAMKHRDVYGGALRYTTPNGRTSIDVGYANGTGRTTGASLTPGLGGSGAFYVSLRVSR